MAYAILAFLIVFLLLASGLLLLFYREALGQRLSSILAERKTPGLLERLKATQNPEALGGFAAIRKTVEGERKTPLRQRLLLAGYREDYHAKLFSLSKLFVPGLLAVIAIVTGLYHASPFVVFGIAGGLGYLAPDYWLDYRIRTRASAIQEGLPDLLDLMVVCLEAGLSIDQATIRSSEEMRFSHPAIAEELSLVMLEVRAGQPRMQAWRRLAERTKVEAVRMFVTIMVQADQFGTGVSRTLRIHSDAMRTKRKQKLEEMANKTAVKLVFPLALFIFPTFFIVVLGPAAILLADTFAQTHK
jgi:tight adherence protein C